MTRDDLVAASLVLSFASLVTVHVTLVASIATHRPRWRALVAFVIVPLTPYWGARHGRWLQVTLWLASAAAYLALRRLAGR
jgi:hypothetical protein